MKIADVTLVSKNWNEVIAHIQVLTSDFEVPEGVCTDFQISEKEMKVKCSNTELSDYPNPSITALMVYETELWYMGVHE